MAQANRTTTLVHNLKNDIIMGHYKPGDKLPPLRELGESYGVSRSVVNAAVATLAVQGYVRIVPRHHVVVVDFLWSGTLVVVGDVLRSDNVPLKRRLTQDALALRQLLTLDAVRTIAANPRIALAPLQKILTQELAWLQNPLKDYSRFWKLDIAFNEMIIRLCENYAFRLLYRNFRYIADGLVIMFFHNLDFIASLVTKHGELLAALKAHDELRAVGACRDMLNSGVAESLKHYV